MTTKRNVTIPVRMSSEERSTIKQLMQIDGEKCISKYLRKKAIENAITQNYLLNKILKKLDLIEK